MELAQWKLPIETYTMGSFLMQLTPCKLPNGTCTMELTPMKLPNGTYTIEHTSCTLHH